MAGSLAKAADDEKDKKPGDKKPAAAAPPAAPAAAPAAAPPAETPPADEPTPEETLPDGMADETETEVEAPEIVPPSGQVLGALHDSVQGIIDNLNGAAATYENPDAISFVTMGVIPKLQEMLSEIEGVYGSVCPGKSVKPMGDAPVEDTLVKSWLARGKHKGLQLGGFAARLNHMAGDKNLTVNQRETLTGVFKHIGRLVNEAKAVTKPVAAKQSPVEDPRYAELAKQVTKTADLFKSMASELKTLVPAK